MSDVLESVKLFSTKARSIIDYEKCYLFGSYAKGTAKDSSDIDIAIITDSSSFGKQNFIKVWSELLALGTDTLSRIEVHLLLKDDDPSGFINVVEQTGIRVA